MPFQYNAQFEDFQYLTAFQLQYTPTWENFLGEFHFRKLQHSYMKIVMNWQQLIN